MNPRAGIVPSAHIKSESLLPGIFHCPVNGGISLLWVVAVALVVLWGIGTAEVNLDEIEVEFLEEEVAVLLLMAVKSYVSCYGVTIIIVATGIDSRV